MNTGTEVVSILWTGGYDSTYRMVELAKKPVIIRPYYLSDKRKSETFELEAIQKISANLMQRQETVGIIEPIRNISKEERVKNRVIANAYKRVRKADFFGSQYDWLGGFAASHPGMELCIHEDDKAVILIKKYAGFKRIDDPLVGPYDVLDVEKAPQDIQMIFQHYHFPVATMTKVGMKEKYLEWGCRDIMNLTWFCFRPINGKPCGTCNPCKYTIEEGMIERFTPEAIERYHAQKLKRGHSSFESILISPLLKLRSILESLIIN